MKFAHVKHKLRDGAVSKTRVVVTVRWVFTRNMNLQ